MSMSTSTTPTTETIDATGHGLQNVFPCAAPDGHVDSRWRYAEAFGQVALDRPLACKSSNGQHGFDRQFRPGTNPAIFRVAKVAAVPPGFLVDDPADPAVAPVLFVPAGPGPSGSTGRTPHAG